MAMTSCVGMFLKSDQAQEKVPFCSRAEAADLIAGLGAEILSSWGLSGNNFHNWERKEVIITRKWQTLYRLVLFRYRLPQGFAPRPLPAPCPVGREPGEGSVGLR